MHGLIDGEAVKSCSVFTVQADGKDVTTIEGLAEEGTLHPVAAGILEQMACSADSAPGIHHGRRVPPETEPGTD